MNDNVPASSFNSAAVQMTSLKDSVLLNKSTSTMFL